MTIKEMQFEPHRVDPSGTRATVEFLNGYGASVVTGRMFYTDAQHPYEIAVLKNGKLCYDTPITDDVIGHLNEEQADSVLVQIEALPPSRQA